MRNLTIGLFFFYILNAQAEVNTIEEKDNNFINITQRFCPDASKSNPNIPNQCVSEYVENVYQRTLNLFENYWPRINGAHKEDACWIYMDRYISPNQSDSLTKFLKDSVASSQQFCSFKYFGYEPSSYEAHCNKFWHRFVNELSKFKSKNSEIKETLIKNSLRAERFQQTASLCTQRLDEIQSIFDHNLINQYTNEIFPIQLANGKNEVSKQILDERKAKELKDANERKDLEIRSQKETADQQKKVELQEKERIRQIVSLPYPTREAILKGFKRGNSEFIIVSTDKDHFYIKRILINNRVGTQYCDNRKIEYMRMGDERNYSTLGYCGNIVTVRVETNRGTQIFNFDAY